jgi:hypothetical protein
VHLVGFIVSIYHDARSHVTMHGHLKVNNIFLCFVHRASRYIRVKKNQLDAQLILSIFRQLLHVSGVSRPIIRRHNRMDTTFCTYRSLYMTVCCPGWIVPSRFSFTLVHNVFDSSTYQNSIHKK